MQSSVSSSVLGAHLSYRADIDGLRAVAVLIVVLFHAFPNMMHGGFVGVDVFFVISGFLISKIIFTSLDHDRFSFADFYARRIKRIFPALILVMTATFAFGWFALFPDEYKLLAKHLVGGAGFISNLMLWFEDGYFDKAAETKPLLHLWSLGIEEQFYIFWPILLVLAYRFRSSVLRLTVTILIISLLINLVGLHRFPVATFYSIASRAWELLTGGLLAYLSLRRVSVHFGGLRGSLGHDPQASRPLFDTASIETRSAMSFAGLILLIAAVSFTVAGKTFPGWWAMLPTAGAGLLIAAGPHAWVNRVLLSNRLVVAIGLISYPLYLWHWPLLSFARIIESGLPSVKIRVAAVAGAVVLATMTYWLLEKPLRRHSRSRYTVAGLASAMVFMAVGAGWVYRQEGLPLRASVVQSAAMQKALLTVEDHDSAVACKARYGFATLWEYCLLDQRAAAPTVALVGDSHAYHVVAGLTLYYREHGENLWYLGTRVPFFGVADGPDTDKYQQATRPMLDLALNTPSVKTVILSTIVKLRQDTPEGRLEVQQFRDTLQRYVAAGKKVIYLYDVPGLDFDPRACIKRAGIPSSTTKVDCSMDRAVYEASVKDHNAIVASILKDLPTVSTFTPVSYLCDAQRCHGIIDGKLMYRDVNHLTYDGDRYIGRKYTESMKAQGL